MRIRSAMVSVLPSLAVFLAAMAVPLGAAESDPPPEEAASGEGEATSSEQEKAEALLSDLRKEGELLRKGRAAAAQYHYTQGMKAREASRFRLAMQHLKRAVDYMPDNEQYREELQLTATLAGVERSPTGVHINRVNEEIRVRQEQLWVEILNSIEEGETLLTEGQFNQAQMALEQARTRLETLPFPDERKPKYMRQVERLLAATAERRRAYNIERQGDQARLAEERAQERRRYELKLEQDRIDAMLRRAMKARERRDYDKAILLAEKVLRINRANTMAHGLIATARRERHKYLRQITADRWDEEHKLLSEHIRQSMLPQLDFVVYPDDWHDIDARRGAPVHGGEQEAQAWKEDIKKKLEQQLVLNFPEMEIQQVVNFLQRNADVNFILDPEVVARGETPPVTMQVKNIKLANALDFIMLQTGLKYALQDEAVYISTPENLQGEAYMKIYEIRDMMVGLTQFPGPSLDIPDPGGQGGALGLEETEDEDAPDVNDFIDIIESVVRPEAWGGDNVSIDEWNGSLIVTQTADVHEEIDKVLRALRNQQAVQINVKVKFLSVENAMLEEIGINWNNFGPTGWRNPIAAGPNPETPASAPPWWLGAYWRSNGSAPDHIIGAQLTNDLQDYSSGSQLTAEGGFNGEIQVFEDPEGFLGRMIIKAVEKSRRGNVAIQPDITLMSGQRSHISRLNQQSYIADYNVVDDQYDPQVTTISYGTVLDVVALASADRRWITLTLRPTTTNITAWRRFGSNIADFGGIDVVNTDADGQDLDAVAGAYPMMVPEVQYRAVETSVTIPDGGSLLVGGFTDSVSARAHAGVPFLSHIPFLGRLFSSNGRSEREFKDMIYVTGDIILFDEIEANL